eukprot:scaffold5325_cov183-Amphora_coffeaeformis.AAC.13
MPKDYDHRRSDRPPRRGEDDADRRPKHNVSSRNKRERSRSPPTQQQQQQTPVEDERARREAQRRAEMERLRMENEEEEKHLDQRRGKGAAEDRVAVAVKPQEEIVEVDEEELEGLDEEEQMRKLMGIEGFGSTKGKKVESNHNSLASGAASKHKARTYRQYMNRKGGFNRPLDKA